MNAQEKTEFVNMLIDNVRDDILGVVKHMPEDWNGLEIRQYIAERFAREKWFSRSRDEARLRRYRNEKATRMGL